MRGCPTLVSLTNTYGFVGPDRVRRRNSESRARRQHCPEVRFEETSPNPVSGQRSVKVEEASGSKFAIQPTVSCQRCGVASGVPSFGEATAWMARRASGDLPGLHSMDGAGKPSGNEKNSKGSSSSKGAKVFMQRGPSKPSSERNRD